MAELLALRRRRWPWVVGAVLVAAVLLTVALAAADRLARDYAANYVTSRIVSALQLPPQTPVTVDLGSGSIILQAMTGSIDQVTIDAPSLTFGDLTGSLHITARNVPLSSAQPIPKLGMIVSVPQAGVAKFADRLSGITPKSIELRDGVIRVATEFSFVFFAMPVTVDLLPTVKDGGIAFDPQRIVLGTSEISAAGLRANPLYSALAGDLLRSKNLCVANYLPRALRIDRVEVVGSNLLISINGDGIALDDPNLAAFGTCP